MRPRWIRHLQKAIKRENGTRPELMENLESILAHKKDEIEAFAEGNISVEYPSMLRIKNFFLFKLDTELVRYYFASVYYANSQYFKREVKTEREKVEISVSSSESAARHIGTGLHSHKVKFAPFWFDTMPSLLYVMDAESRHTVHDNLHNDRGIEPRYLADRAYLVVSETLDRGDVYRGGHKISPQKDPFLNDFSMVNEQNGHNAAHYMSRHLALDRTARWMQLYWLSRLIIRPNIPESDGFKELANLLHELSSADEERLKLTAEEGDGVYFSGVNPYQFGIGPLIGFYYGNKLIGIFEEKLAEARKFAIRHFPYEVSDSESVLLNGNRITRFASQLDFVVLKLATAKPNELYAEARGK